MMSVIALSLPEMIILRKVLKPRLIATFFGVVALGAVMTAKVEALGPRGQFTIDATLRRPAVLIGAGVGISGFEVDGEGKGKLAWQLGAGVAFGAAAQPVFGALDRPVEQFQRGGGRGGQLRRRAWRGGDGNTTGRAGRGWPRGIRRRCRRRRA